ncbi:Acyl-CoA N-acyltransferase [Naviculisporaceae sp. PSN 640]
MLPLAVSVRPMRPEDWPQVVEIYRRGIKTGNATFDPEPPSWEHFDKTHRSDLRLVAVAPGGYPVILGWAAASPVSSRPVYAGVVEESVYIAEYQHGRGIGRALLKELLRRADEVGVWTVQASIFPENTASLRLHESAGFRVVGRRERIARMAYGPWAGQWRDTILVERRSASS